MNKYYLEGFSTDKKAEIERTLAEGGYKPYEDADNPGKICFHSDKSRKQLINFASHGAKLRGPYPLDF